MPGKSIYHKAEISDSMSDSLLHKPPRPPLILREAHWMVAGPMVMDKLTILTTDNNNFTSGVSFCAGTICNLSRRIDWRRAPNLVLSLFGIRRLSQCCLWKRLVRSSKLCVPVLMCSSCATQSPVSPAPARPSTRLLVHGLIQCVRVLTFVPHMR